MHAALLELLKSRQGHFPLESGHHGTLWLDLDRLFVRPARLTPFAAELAARLAPHRISAVCGPFSGGAFLAQLVATALDADCYYAERHSADNTEPHSIKYRVPVALRADLRGLRVAVVDDAINAGSAVRATLADLDACGAVPAAIAALLTLGPAAERLAAERRLPLECIAAHPNQIWMPSDCPLCAADVPLERPLG